MINKIPNEILNDIFKYLSIKDLYNLKKTNLKYNLILNNYINKIKLKDKRNFDKIKIGSTNIKNNDLIITVLYDEDELSIKVPNNKDSYFELYENNNDFFNYCLNLEIMEYMDDFEEQYKNNFDKISIQKEAIEFSKLINELNNKIINCFLEKLKIDKEFVSANFSNFKLKDYELNKYVWDEINGFSYKTEEINNELILRHRLHVNKNNKKEKNFILKCNIVVKNKYLEQRTVYINWYID